MSSARIKLPPELDRLLLSQLEDCIAKAWIEDQDAVPNKAAAYYTYVVKH